MQIKHEQVKNQVGGQVRVQVKYQVGDQVWNQVGDQVGDQVWNQVGSQIREDQKIVKDEKIFKNPFDNNR